MSSSSPTGHPNPANDRLAAAVAMARQAGQLTLTYFRRGDLSVEFKSDASPVTAADRAAEQLIRDQIAESFPDDGILGEEFGDQPGRTSYQWVIDPIDGTKSFVCGVPLYTTLVAVLNRGRPIIGVIYAPAGDELVYASQGGGCFYACGAEGPSATTVSLVERLADGVVLTSDVDAFASSRNPPASHVIEQLEKTARYGRTWGDAYGYLMVATGRAEVMIDPIMNLWDAAALQPVIEEAGGFFGDWNGEPTVHHGESVATNGRVTAEVLAITRGQESHFA